MNPAATVATWLAPHIDPVWAGLAGTAVFLGGIIAGATLVVAALHFTGRI